MNLPCTSCLVQSILLWRFKVYLSELLYPYILAKLHKKKKKKKRGKSEVVCSHFSLLPSLNSVAFPFFLRVQNSMTNMIILVECPLNAQRDHYKPGAVFWKLQKLIFSGMLPFLMQMNAQVMYTARRKEQQSAKKCYLRHFICFFNFQNMASVQPLIRSDTCTVENWPGGELSG